jgi:hypothetical protein
MIFVHAGGISVGANVVGVDRRGSWEQVAV